MRKSTLALFSAAVSASSAQAVILIDSESYGTKVEFIGSARFKWTSTSDKTSPTNGGTTHNHVNYAVANNGSRFGFRVTQQLANNFYTLGRIEWRFRGTASSQHDFDDIYTRQLYAGIGHRKYGELIYGNFSTITDDVKQTDLPHTLSLSDGLLTASSRRTLQYTYKGIKGLKLGIFYGGHSPRGNTGLTLTNPRKDIWGFGSIYSGKLDNMQSYKAAFGVTRDRFSQSQIHAYDRTAYSLGLAYTLNKTTFGLDLERRVTHNQSDLGNKRVEKEMRTVIYHRITDDWRAYTMYAYKTNRLNAAAASDTAVKKHQFMMGTEYNIIPEYFKVFIEWQATRARNYQNHERISKTRNYTTVVGLRIYW